MNQGQELPADFQNAQLLLTGILASPQARSLGALALTASPYHFQDQLLILCCSLVKGLIV